MSESTTTSTRERALALLGDGIPPSMVASALGVTDSAISQLLSDSSFAEQVVQLKYFNLLKHSERDKKADDIEDRLLDKLKDTCEFLMDPLKIAVIYSKINAAKRRGTSAPDSLIQQNNIVQLVMPSVVVNQYSAEKIQVNINNQVVKAGNQELVTVQSGRMDTLAQSRRDRLKLGAPNEQTSNSG